ncbi:MAG: lysine--tRNA ligase [Bacteroidales bacterium]|nr:lysine--tRNA ligase [Bacteroidales bacterium]
MSEPTDLTEFRREKMQNIADMGRDPWGQRFDGRTPIADIRALPAAKFDDAGPSGPKVRAAGRVVRHRTGGKLHFLELWDQTGRVQLMARINKLSPEDWKLLECLDLGDIIGVDGEFGTTKTGEPTIQVEQLTFLTKSLEPHPKDVYGLGDMEYRLRHRYLDMIYTPDTLRRAQQRVKIIRTVRNYLDERGYLEVETPTLHAIAGGAAARPFETHHNALDIDLFLRIALELPLKRLLVGGLEKVYEIGRVFRNEGISPRHNPEFTMLELYEAYGDLFSIMDLTEGLIVACVDSLGGGRALPCVSRQCVPVVSMRTCSANTLAVPGDAEGVQAAAAAAGLRLELRDDKTGTVTTKEHDVLVHELFEHRVEPQLAKSDQPIFVYDYPAALCPLTKRKRENPALAERFELYVHGMELANAYTELNDPITQEATFRRQLVGMSEEDSMAKMDEDFIRALRYGMPPAGGLGIGMDRLVMLLTNTTSIRDVILFPLLRPEKA